MATFDLTAKSTTGVGANSIATLPANAGTHMVRTIQEYLDIDALIAAGNSISDGDVFQMLEIPAGTLVLNAGAEVMSAFTGSCTLDMDFGGGDDIIDPGVNRSWRISKVKGGDGHDTFVIKK